MTLVFTNNETGSSGEFPAFIHRWVADKNMMWVKFRLINKWQGKLQVCVWDSAEVLRLQSGFAIGYGSFDYMISHRPQECSLGAVPGILPGGEWDVEIFAYGVDVVSYALEVTWGMSKPAVLSDLATMAKCWVADCAAPLLLNGYPWQKRLRTGRRWYRGDFHTHSTMSDGRLTPDELTALAEDRGLDFLAITDHNMLPTGWVKSNLLVIPGMEISSRFGHFNAIGLNQYIDWRPNHPDQGIMSHQGLIRLMIEGREAGAFCSLNHPSLNPWDWQVGNLPLTKVDALEIWNDPTYPDNRGATERAIEAWTILWNEGYKIVGIGGSDSHLRPEERYPGADAPSLVGDPMTCVLTDGLSAEEILNGLFAGRVYITRGPELIFQAQVDERIFDPGSDLGRELRSDDVVFWVRYADVPAGSRLIWLANGKTVASAFVSGCGCQKKSMLWSPAVYSWMRAEIRDSNGNLLAITNPIYQGEKRPNIQTWAELLARFRGYKLKTPGVN